MKKYLVTVMYSWSAGADRVAVIPIETTGSDKDAEKLAQYQIEQKVGKGCMINHAIAFEDGEA